MKSIFNIVLAILAMVIAICVFNGAITLLKYVGTAFILVVGCRFIWKKYIKK